MVFFFFPAAESLRRSLCISFFRRRFFISLFYLVAIAFARENCIIYLNYMIVEREATERERKRKREERKKTLLPAFSISKDSFFSCVQAILKSQSSTISSLLTVLVLFKLLLLLLLLLLFSLLVSFFFFIFRRNSHRFSPQFFLGFLSGVFHFFNRFDFKDLRSFLGLKS